MQYPIILKMEDGTEKQFWLSDEKLQFGGDTEVPVKGVQVAGVDLTPDADGKVNIPSAATNRYGTVKVSQSYGTNMTQNGILQVVKASNDDIEQRRPDINRTIQPYNLNYAVTAALTDSNHLSMTSDQMDTCCSVIGAEREPYWELIEEFTMQTTGKWEKTADTQGKPYNFRNVLVIRTLPAGTDISDSSGYGRIKFRDNNGLEINSECGRFQSNTTAYQNMSYNDRMGNFVKMVYTRTATSGDVNALYTKQAIGVGIQIGFGNIVNVYSVDNELAGVKVVIYGVRA